MSDKTIQDSLSAMEKLTPDARQRVQDALKASIEAELIGSRINEAAEFSRGWVFSRSRPKPDSLQEDQILQNAMSMDEASFAKFAKNLAQLKGRGQSG